MANRLFLLVLTHVTTLVSCKIGKIRFPTEPIRELNPGPCDGFPPEGPTCCCGGTGSNPSANRSCAQACPASPAAVPCCCPGAFGPQCKTCPGTKRVYPYPTARAEVSMCNDHGVCDGSTSGSAVVSGKCYCSNGYSGDDCKITGSTPKYPDLMPPLTATFFPLRFSYTAYVTGSNLFTLTPYICTVTYMTRE
jgi:hypothetical protein